MGIATLTKADRGSYPEGRMSLQYNVSALLKEAVGSTRAHDVDSAVIVEDGGQPRRQPVAGRVRLLKTKDGVLVTAQLGGSEREVCSRCLREIDVPVKLELDEEFYASVDPDTGASLPPPEDPEAFRIDKQQTLDIEEVVRQGWAAARPMQAICREDCRGLCARCGRDLNEGPCGCEPEPDERWSALRELAGKPEGK